ncbi:MAG TPA: Hsp20/alpha crystallin family protein [Ktedonobacteraceae bacterium]|jgi:HSP20 family protein
MHTQESQSIPVNVYKTLDRLMAAAPMPGLEPEDIIVDITADRRLILHGEPRGSLKDTKETLSVEWNAGPYHREIELATAVDGTHANVTYGNGVVTVVLPISEQTHAAHVTLARTGATHGKHKGNAGHPPV